MDDSKLSRSEFMKRDSKFLICRKDISNSLWQIVLSKVHIRGKFALDTTGILPAV
jgi:hypothetical protein